MRWSDLVTSSLSSLRQRLFRTALTVLGVLIGITSMVVMISLGVGMSQSLIDSMQNDATMTRVIVSPGSGGAMGSGQPGSKSDEKVLDERLMAEFGQLEGVEKVTPVYEVDAEANIGGHKGYLRITSMPADALADEGLDLGEGRLFGPGDPLSVVVGSKVNQNFAVYTSEAADIPEIDWMNEQLFLTFGEQDAQPVPTGEEQKPVSAPRRFIVPVSGVIAGDEASFSMSDYSVFADYDQLLAALRKAYPGKALPGQPATQDGKPRGTSFHYSAFYLKADSVQRAESLTSELRDQGYNVSSNIELMRQVQQMSLVISAVFGAIGLISLLVAAIGIANTMLMSVYERTKQIGVMKVLGASLGDIRKMFLMESAFIGLIGGVIGVLFSYLLSAGVNLTLGQSAGAAMGLGTKISVIPPWLALAALAFATLVGTASGIIPANRAMRLSPLAAIRSE